MIELLQTGLLDFLEELLEFSEMVLCDHSLLPDSIRIAFIQLSEPAGHHLVNACSAADRHGVGYADRQRRGLVNLHALFLLGSHLLVAQQRSERVHFSAFGEEFQGLVEPIVVAAVEGDAGVDQILGFEVIFAELIELQFRNRIL